MAGMACAASVMTAGRPVCSVNAAAASAVAFDKAADKLGFCHSKLALDEASVCAVSECQKAGGQNCKLIASGTVEEKVMALQETKRALLADVFEASDATAAKLSLADLKALL